MGILEGMEEVLDEGKDEGEVGEVVEEPEWSHGIVKSVGQQHN